MLIGVPLETAAGQARAAVTPVRARKLKSLRHMIKVRSVKTCKPAARSPLSRGDKEPASAARTTR